MTRPIPTLPAYLSRLFSNGSVHKPNVTAETIQGNLKLGDHIFTGRKGDTYFHHGIYESNDSVFHYHAPHKASHIKNSVACEQCDYMPREEAAVVRTCLKCFLMGHSLHVREYGICVSGTDIEDWVLEELKASEVIYTCRNGFVYLGKWTENNKVSHKVSRGTRLCEECVQANNEGSIVDTCLPCFLEDGVLCVNAVGLQVVMRDGENLSSCWPSLIPYSRFFFNRCPQAKSFYRPTYKSSHAYYGLRSIQATVNLFRKPKAKASDKADYSSIIYENRQVQVCISSSKSPNEVISKAKELLKNGFGNYDLFSNNCEHFASSCKTGSPQSIVQIYQYLWWT